jgi:CHAD domain-containing protein
MKAWPVILNSTLRWQWKSYRKALKRCRKNVSEKAVHATRVENRRLSAQLELYGIFAPARTIERACRALKAHREAFDELRDTQVQLALVRRHVRVFPETKPLCEALRRREKRCRQRVSRRLDRLKPERVKPAVAALRGHWDEATDHPGRQVHDRKIIGQSVDAAFARLVTRTRRMDAAQVRSIHRTRVALKKFRYMLEALQPMMPGIPAAHLRRMQSLQSVFGDLQDTNVFLERLQKYARDKPARASALDPYRRWLLRRRTAQVHRCLGRAEAIQRLWPLRRSRGAAPSIRPMKPTRMGDTT